MLVKSISHDKLEYLQLKIMQMIEMRFSKFLINVI